MDDKTNSTPAPALTEKDLLRNFEAYQQLLEELEKRYEIPGPRYTPPTRETAESPYVLEPVFFYKTHAST